MLDRTRHLRLALVLIAGLAAGLFPILGPLARSLGPKVAWADDDDDDDDDGDDDDSGGGDDDDDDEEEVDETQPPITAGGLFTIKTYPQGEIQRPLTMTEGITELKLGVGFDISNETAFETFGISGDARYGVKDNVEVRGGFALIALGSDAGAQWNAYAAFEGSIIYDLVDFRIGAQIDHSLPAVVTTDAKAATNFSIPIGVPFRYAPKEQVAVTAFEQLFSIQFNSKPDATPNVGIVVQPAPIVAIILKAGLTIPDFNFKTENVRVPASAAVQLSPTNKIDAGMEFRFNNLKPAPIPPATEAPPFYDDRFLLFFGRLRI